MPEKYCPMCDSVVDYNKRCKCEEIIKMTDDNLDDIQPVSANTLIYEKGWREGYNAAIEAAAKVANKLDIYYIEREIRKLKK